MLIAFLKNSKAQLKILFKMFRLHSRKFSLHLSLKQNNKQTGENRIFLLVFLFKK